MSIRPVDQFSGTDRFRIRRRLGAGGMGVVYEAYDRERDQAVALKTILRMDATSLYRFKKEFRALADVSHPNLVRLYELISDGDLWFFTMELIEGTDFLRFVCPEGPLAADDPIGDPSTLSSTPTNSLEHATAPDSHHSASLINPLDVSSTAAHVSVPPREPSGPGTGSSLASTRTLTFQNDSTAGSPPETAGVTRHGSNGGRLGPPPHLLRLRAGLRQLAEALHVLHRSGKVHRDLKPSNVLVSHRGRVVLMDFGLTTELEHDLAGQTSEGMVVGTAGYMAPEQAAGRLLTSASDWYSVGVILYRALTGRLPHQGSAIEVMMAKQSCDPRAPVEVVPDVPADLSSLCMSLLSRDPDARPTGEEVLRLLGSDPARDASGDGFQAGSRPFFGRESHLAALRAAFAEVVQGGTVTALVHGRSGAGKSALVGKFLDGLKERGDAVILSGRCFEQESVAYKAMDTLIDALSRHLRNLTRGEVEALLPRDVSALSKVFPVLRRVDAIADAPQRVAEIADQQELRRRAFGSLRELLARMGDRKPLVLYIDDLQWGDLDSAVLLSDLLRPPDPPSLLLLCCYRSEYVDKSPCLARLLSPGDSGLTADAIRDVPVRALTAEEARALAMSLFHPGDPGADFKANLIARESGGSPFFVYELALHLKEGGDLAEREEASTDGWTLDQVLWRRVSRLPDDARALLETIAVAGQPIRQSIACRASGLGADGYAALGVLRVQHLVRGTGPGTLDDVESYHDRIRETVMNHIDDGSRTLRHRGLARELEESGRGDPETLAIHFEAAHDREKAWKYFAEAAREAAASLAFDRAAKLYRRAIELRPPGDGGLRELKARLGDALANSGRGVEAAQAYQGAAEGASQAEILELQRRAAYQLIISGHIDEGLAAFRVVLDLHGIRYPSTPRRALISLLGYRALLRLRGLRFRERRVEEIDARLLDRADICRAVAVGISNVDVIRGANLQTRSTLLALRCGERSRVARSLAWEAVHTSCAGGPARKRTARLIETASGLVQVRDDPHTQGMVMMARGASSFLEGRFADGVRYSDEAHSIFNERCTGVMWELDTSQLYALWSLIYLGRLVDLRRRFLSAFQHARERGNLYIESTLGPYIGTFSRMARGEIELARAETAESIAKWTQRGFHVQHLDDFYANVYLDLYSGDGASAWRRVTEKGPLARASMLTRIQQVRIDVLQISGRSAVAAAARASDPAPLLREAESYADKVARERMPWADPLADLIRAGMAAVRRDASNTERLLGRAARGFEAVDMGLFAAASRRRLGRLVGGDEGRALVESADAWMAQQAIVNPARMTACLAPGHPDD